MQQSLLKLSPLQGTIIAMVVIATLGVTMIAWGFVPHLSLIISAHDKKTKKSVKAKA